MGCSRPLTSVSSDPQDLEALTPNHFLLGRSNPAFPLDIVTDKDLSSRKRWRHAQVMVQHFWKRWLCEYLPKLTERRKWNRSTRNVSEGELVLVVDEHSPRGHWPLARVIRVFFGDGNVVKSVEIKTKRGTYVRPIAKICLLEEVSEA